MDVHWLGRGGGGGEGFMVLVKRARGGAHGGLWLGGEAFGRSLLEMRVERDGALCSDEG